MTHATYPHARRRMKGVGEAWERATAAENRERTLLLVQLRERKAPAVLVTPWSVAHGIGGSECA